LPLATRALFSAVFSLVMFVPAALVLENLTVFGAWIVFWACCFSGLLLTSWSREIRGFLVLLSSVLLATAGVAYSTRVSPEDLWAVKLFAELMVLSGAGVGANYLSAGLLDREASGRKPGA